MNKQLTLDKFFQYSHNKTMQLSNKNILWIPEADRDDIYLVGNKGANIGEMARNGFPLPPGFIITTNAYKEFLDENNLQTIITHLLEGIDYTNNKSIEKVSSIIKKKILYVKISSKIATEIFTAYKKLGKGILKNPSVTISISSAQELPLLQQEISDIKGESTLIIKIKELWASLYSPESIQLLNSKNSNPLKVQVAIVIQKIMPAEKSGVIYTIDPLTSDKNKIIVEATYGLPEFIAQPEKKPDHYEVSKRSLTITKKTILPQKSMYIQQKEKKKQIKIPLKEVTQQKITNEEIIELATLAKKLEKHHYFPQRIEWIQEKGTIYFTRINHASPSGRVTPIENMQPVTSVTKIYIALSSGEKASETAQQFISGVGLFNPEIIIKKIGIHPKELIHNHKQKNYIDAITKELEQCCQAFSPRPVIYQVSDLTTESYRNLIGGKHYEPKEEIPALGFHGIYRHIHDPQLFNLELEAIKIVRNQKEWKNIWLILPFVRTPSELKEIKEIIKRAGLYRSANFKVWVKIEIPSNVLLIEQFIQTGIDGLLIDSDKLSTLLLARDISNSTLLQNNQLDDTILLALENVITAANKNNIPISLYGEATQYPTVIERLVSLGVTSFTVQPENIQKTQQSITKAEKKLLKS